MKLQLSMAHFTLYNQGATGLRHGPSFDGSPLHRTGCQVTCAHVSASNQQRLGLFAVLFLNMDLITFYSFSLYFHRQFSFLGKKIFLENMVLCPSRVCFLISCILIQVFSQSSLSYVAI